ncbi:helix-turn-helix transcriptional regulator [Acrocarpospora catenulata]|uniref:helix-turn-helix transcriptional regulator n=1 Tax=Acrocarpospora catenulata TaxID=2836182 RepID=UPI002023A736|nr:excisionase [Acrocarpospora catenulata]
MTVIDVRKAANHRGYWMTVPEILADLQIPRRTWQRWRALGKTPECTRLPNGDLRVKRHDYDAWLDSLAEDERNHRR